MPMCLCLSQLCTHQSIYSVESKQNQDIINADVINKINNTLLNFDNKLPVGVDGCTGH